MPSRSRLPHGVALRRRRAARVAAVKAAGWAAVLGRSEVGPLLAALEAPCGCPLYPCCPPSLASPLATLSFGCLAVPAVRPQTGAEFILNVIPTRLAAVQGVAVLVSRVPPRRVRCRRMGGLHPDPRPECRPPSPSAPCVSPLCTRTSPSCSAAAAGSEPSAARARPLEAGAETLRLRVRPTRRTSAGGTARGAARLGLSSRRCSWPSAGCAGRRRGMPDVGAATVGAAAHAAVSLLLDAAWSVASLAAGGPGGRARADAGSEEFIADVGTAQAIGATGMAVRADTAASGDIPVQWRSARRDDGGGGAIWGGTWRGDATGGDCSFSAWWL